MEFTTDIFTLLPPASRKFELAGVSLPTNKDVYYRAKQREIIDQYAAARNFLRETETDDWGHWFNSVENETNNTAFQLIFTTHFYEAALMFYNIVVDLSWTMCYVSAEYACYKGDEPIDFSGIKSIDEAYRLLRKAENTVTSPSAVENPFLYLKSMCPDFESAIDLIIDFWKDFFDSVIRANYNFIKHKGKPAYVEIEALRPTRFMNIYLGKDKVQVPSDIRDVQKSLNLKNSINDLIKFDDEELFPYIRKLLELLEEAIKPSPMI